MLKYFTYEVLYPIQCNLSKFLTMLNLNFHCFHWSLPSAMAGYSKHLYVTKLPGSFEVLLSLCFKNTKTKQNNTKAACFVRTQSKQEHTPKELQHLYCQLRNKASTAAKCRKALPSGFLVQLGEVNGTPLAPAVTAGYEGYKTQHALSQILLPLRLTYNL